MDTQTDGQTDGQIDRQTNRQTDKQMSDDGSARSRSPRRSLARTLSDPIYGHAIDVQDSLVAISSDVETTEVAVPTGIPYDPKGSDRIQDPIGAYCRGAFRGVRCGDD